ncbi:digestive cysteine proteinase 1-like [Euwallacea fornicatus]|uniref:digestive cysteine proteinase 1-like n=1 Tax=Euwallacea fornicatus TaxID=995702 RepID=UPI00338DF261
MKSLVILVISLTCVALASLQERQEVFQTFKNQHAKTYASSEEEALRFKIFQENLQIIENHNRLFEAGLATYQMGVTTFADYSKEEFQALLKRQSKGKPLYHKTKSFQPPLNQGDLPTAVDWRDVGAVSRVKNQGSCGSCWAFSVTGTLESFYYLSYKEKVEFSEQQLIDCDKSNNACNGGDESPAMEYFMKNGIETEETYPYVGKKEVCKYKKSDVKAALENYIAIDAGDEYTLLMVTGQLGPTSIALDASELQHYTSGIFTGTTCSQISTNHAVLTVGYDHDKATDMDYWIVKNSWGENWGESGYFRIRRGTNECAIAMDSVYPSFVLQPNGTIEEN